MKTFLLTATCALLLAGCAQIPPEAPKLSQGLGKEIGAFEAANLSLLNQYFELKRAQVDRFMQEKWVPAFCEHYFAQPDISQAWNTVVQENNLTQREAFILTTASAMQKQITKKRSELMEPLTNLQSSIETRMRTRYADAMRANATLTALLASASKVSDLDARVLNAAGISDKEVTSVIDKTDTIVSALLATAGQSEAFAQSAERYMHDIEQLKQTLAGEDYADQPK